jgi:flagellar basal body P-ring formation protein FlgA
MKRAAIFLFLTSGAVALAGDVATNSPRLATQAPSPAPVAAQTPNPDALQLSLKPVAVSEGDEILLEDLVELSAAQMDAKPLWLKYAVCHAASPGQVRTVLPQEIRSALRRNGVETQIEFSGATETRVTAQAQAISPEDITVALQDAVRVAYEHDSDLETSVEVVSLQPLNPLRPGPVDISVDLPNNGIRPGSVSLRVAFSQNNRRIADTSVAVRVKVIGTLTVAGDRIPGGTVLSDGDLRTLRRELSSSELEQRCDAHELIGLRAKQTLSAGRPVTKRMVAEPLLVKRGDAVSIVVRRGALELSTRGEARSDAALHDTVRVFVPQSEAEIMARVTGPREVSMDDPRTNASR